MTRKAINFDLDTKALQEFYPNKNWRKAFDDLKSLFIENGFEHRQGSGYISLQPISNTAVLKTIKLTVKSFPWFAQCVNHFDVTNIGDTFDMLNIINEASEKVRETALDDTETIQDFKDKIDDVVDWADRVNDACYERCLVRDNKPDHSYER